MSAPIAEMSARAREVFRLVVESYLGTGAPVGSKTLAQFAGLGLSSASIRGVMHDLEELGLLSAPHTSAGRMPTHLGLRLFVDGMMQAAEPSAEERSQIEARARRTGSVEDALTQTSAVLSGLSACAGIVLVPPRQTVVRHFSFLPLSGTQAVAVLVDEDGTVENRVVAIPPGTTAGALTEASNYISRALSGLTLADARARLEREVERGRAALDLAAAELVRRGLVMWSEDGARRPVLIVRGAANLLDAAAAEDIERVRRLLDDIEGKAEIAQLLATACDAGACKIFIGAENKLFALSGSSVIAAPYSNAEGRVVGVVGVIGPTRLNYARVVPMVDFTAQTLTRLLA